MTDAAVVADSGPAPDTAPAGAVISENAPSFSEPLGSQIPPEAQAKPDAPAKVSLDDSIDRAMAKAEARQAEAAKPKEAKPEAKLEPKEPPARGEGGKFAAKEPVKPAVADSAKPADGPRPVEAPKPSHTAEDAPARFTDTAKAKWHAADPEIRGEVLRMQRELTDGYQKYKTAAERDGSLAEFHDMAKASGKELPNVVREYVNMENHLRKDLVGGLNLICERMGVSLRDVASHVLNQTPDQQASQSDATIRELRQELAGLKEQLGGVTQTIQEQRKEATLTEVNKFAAAHPRFEELADAISEELKHGYSLEDAYSRAERLNPAPAGVAKDEDLAASSAAPDPAAHPDKGQKSITGAPAAGSTPSGKKREKISLDESLNRAFSRAG